MSRRFRPLPNGSAMAPGTTGVLSRVLSGRPKERAIKLTAALLLAALGTYSLLRSSLPPPTASRVYGLMIDAGSTGSRVHTFAFDRVADPAAAAASAAAATSAAAAKAAAAKAAKLQLHDEDFLAIKPGLSSFKTDPKAAADSLLPLLARAQEVIPASQWEQTPVFLRATAGLRMVGEEAADRILREVRQTLAASEFRFDEDKGTEWAKILGGSDEGIYSWITVNYLLDRRPDDTVGTLEMGGGSSQVAFVPPVPSTPTESCATPSQPVSFKGRPLPLYTTSHLEYGLKKSKAVALAAFESTNNLTGNPCFHAGALDVGVPFETRSVQVVGTGDFDGCVAALQSRLQTTVSPCNCELCTYGRVAQPPAGPSEFVAFAFYAERTTDIGMASPLTLADIRTKGTEVCAMGIEEVRQAYPEGTVKNGVATDLCYDMAFIYTHLAVGHGLHNAPGTRISVVHKINGYVEGQRRPLGVFAAG